MAFSVNARASVSKLLCWWACEKWWRKILRFFFQVVLKKFLRACPLCARGLTPLRADFGSRFREVPPFDKFALWWRRARWVWPRWLDLPTGFGPRDLRRRVAGPRHALLLTAHVRGAPHLDELSVCVATVGFCVVVCRH